MINRPDLQTVRAIVAAACTAPSGGNMQPWRWVYEDDALRLFLDRSRAVSLLDFQRTAGIMALGAAAETAVLAAHRAGLEVALSLVLEPVDGPSGASGPDPEIARLRLGVPAGAEAEPHDNDALAEAIERRETNRRPGARRSIPADQVAALQAVVASLPGARLQLLTEPPALDAIAPLLGACDRIRMTSSALHADMMGEVRFTTEDAVRTRDGVDLRTLDLPLPMQWVVKSLRSQRVVRAITALTGGKALEATGIQPVSSAGAVGLITMPGATPRDYFAGGRALQRLWLRVTQLGMAMQPMSVLPYLFARVIRGGGAPLGEAEVAELRALRARYVKIFEVTDDNAEILLFRLTEAPAPGTRALRRSVEDVLEVRGT